MGENNEEKKEKKHISDPDEQQQQHSFEGLLSAYRPMLMKERKVYHEHPSIGKRTREIGERGERERRSLFRFCCAFLFFSHHMFMTEVQ